MRLSLVDMVALVKRLRAVGILLPFFLVFVFSCSINTNLPKEDSNSKDKGRILFYVHMKQGLTPPPLVLVLKSAVLQGEEKGELYSGEAKLNAHDILKNQLFVSGSTVAPGKYKTLVLTLSDGGKESVYSLGLNLDVAPGSSAVVTLEWDANVYAAGSKATAFTPRAQEVIPALSMAMVSNYDEGYVSIVDRETGRVVSAVSVGKGPTSIEFSVDRNVAYVLNKLSGNISVVDLGLLTVSESIGLFSGIGAFEMVLSKGGAVGSEEKLYIVNASSEDVTIINPRSKMLIKTVKSGKKPVHIALNTHRKELYVANEWSNDVTVISTVSDSVTGTIPVSLRPTGLVVSNDDIYVLSASEKSVAVYSLLTRKESARLYLEHAPERGIMLASGRIFVVTPVNDELVSVSGVLNVSGSTIGVGREPFGIAADEYRSRLFVANRGDGTVSIVDYLSESVEKTLRVGNKPYDVTIAK